MDKGELLKKAIDFIAMVNYEQKDNGDHGDAVYISKTDELLKNANDLGIFGNLEDIIIDCADRLDDLKTDVLNIKANSVEELSSFLGDEFNKIIEDLAKQKESK